MAFVVEGHRQLEATGQTSRRLSVGTVVPYILCNGYKYCHLYWLHGFAIIGSRLGIYHTSTDIRHNTVVRKRLPWMIRLRTTFRTYQASSRMRGVERSRSKQCHSRFFDFRDFIQREVLGVYLSQTIRSRSNNALDWREFATASITDSLRSASSVVLADWRR